MRWDQIRWSDQRLHAVHWYTDLCCAKHVQECNIHDSVTYENVSFTYKNVSFNNHIHFTSYAFVTLSALHTVYDASSQCKRPYATIHQRLQAATCQGKKNHLVSCGGFLSFFLSFFVLGRTSRRREDIKRKIGTFRASDHIRDFIRVKVPRHFSAYEQQAISVV